MPCIKTISPREDATVIAAAMEGRKAFPASYSDGSADGDVPPAILADSIVLIPRFFQTSCSIYLWVSGK